MAARGIERGAGTQADPLHLAQQGATAGQVLRWDAAANSWKPGPAISAMTPPFRGSGTTADPLSIVPGNTQGALLYWNGTEWKATTARAPVPGELLRWNAGTNTWEPAGVSVSDNGVGGTTVALGWAAPSDRRIKTDFLTIDGENILNNFRGLELGTWRYKQDIGNRRHYGIMAQDFHRLFGSDGVGAIVTDTTVNNLDMMGVAYLTIQALETRTAELLTTMKALQAEVNALRTENSVLRERLK